MQRSRPPHAQQGFTLFGLVLWAVVAAFIGLIGVRTFPSINEYLTIRRVVGQVAQQSPATPQEARKIFDKQREVEFAKSDFTSADLQFANINDRLTIRYAYDREVEIFGPVSLLIHYQGSAP